MADRWWTLAGVAGLALLGVTAVNCGNGGSSTGTAPNPAVSEGTAGTGGSEPAGAGSAGDAGPPATGSADSGGAGTGGAGNVGGSSPPPGSGSGGSPAVSDYAAEAERVARVLWDPDSDAAAVEQALMDAFRALGLGVYDPDDRPVLEGSGSPADGGVYLRDYEVTLLARSFVRFRENWGDLRIPLDGILAWEELGVTLYDSACRPVEFTLQNVRDILQTEYVYPRMAGFPDPDYFLGNLVAELELQNPNKAISSGARMEFDDLDPVQAFLIALDWITEPLESGFTQAVSLCDLPGFPSRADRRAASKGTGPGRWGWVRSRKRVKSAISDALDLIKAEMIVYGTKIRVAGPGEMHYLHAGSSGGGLYEITATVEFIDDYGELLAGRKLPEKGPMPGVLVRFETTDLERHGTVESGRLGDWDVSFPASLAWDVRTDPNGQVSFLFRTRVEDPVEEFEVIDRAYIWAYANPLELKYIYGQVAMLLFPIQEIAFFDVSWHEPVCELQ